MQEFSKASLTVEQAFRPRERVMAAAKVSARPLRIALINPRFEPSFTGYEFFLPLMPGGVSAEATGGALPLLAALCPPPHAVELFDENVAPIDFAQLHSFDIVGVTGMIVQRGRIREILQALSRHPGLVIVGGAYVSVDQAFFSGLCDAIFVGEADVTWPSFVASMANGEAHRRVYEQDERTDMTTLPVPRFDLLEAARYRAATIQYSRGCPFLCEFCDIITVFGRKPRTKTPEQVVAELEFVRRLGFSDAFLAADNFIGNMKMARELLVILAQWQVENGYPLGLRTEATINLADEPELLELLYAANFVSVFIGIESPSEASLKEVRKVQNLRGEGSLLDKVARIRDAGLIVSAGFIVGFDSDDAGIFERQFAFIQEARIASAAVYILTAIPTTPLYERLRKEGRLRLDNPDCNFEPRQMSSEDLNNDYLKLVRRLYEPAAYFERLLGSWEASSSFRQRWAQRAKRRKTPASKQRLSVGFVAALTIVCRLSVAMHREGELVRLGRAYLAIYRDYRRNGERGIRWTQFILYAAMHWHFYLLYKRASQKALSRQGGCLVGVSNRPAWKPER